MAGEAQVTDTPAEAQQAQASAGTENTERAGAEPTEIMLPKSRFDEVNRQLKELKAQAAAQAEAQRKAEEQRLAEQNQYKELWEQAQAKAAEVEAKLREAELRQWRNDAATKAGLKPGLAERLRGATPEEIEADAQALAAELPKPSAPNVNAGPGDGAVPSGGRAWWAKAGYPSKQEAAARLNLDIKTLPD